MSNPFFEKPILNSPYEYPSRHWELDETDGLVATDSSGNGNDGDLTGEVEWRPGEGQFKGALWFSPDDIYATLRVPTTGMSVAEGTLMVWGKLVEPYPTNRDNASYFFGHTTWPSFNNRMQLYMNNTDTILDLGLGDSHTRRTDILTLETEIWYHVALTWDVGNYVVYVNGDVALYEESGINPTGFTEWSKQANW